MLRNPPKISEICDFPPLYGSIVNGKINPVRGTSSAVNYRGSPESGEPGRAPLCMGDRGPYRNECGIGARRFGAGSRGRKVGETRPGE